MCVKGGGGEEVWREGPIVECRFCIGFYVFYERDRGFYLEMGNWLIIGID